MTITQISDREIALQAQLVAMTASRDEYQQAADKMAMEHKVERDTLRQQLAEAQSEAEMWKATSNAVIDWENVQISADLIQHAATELKHQCGGRCNAEYNPCWALELADKLQCALKQPNISEYPEKDISAPDMGNHISKSAQPVREPLSDEQIEKLRDKTFSINNPFCPVDSKSMRKAVRAAERAHGIGGDK